MNGLLPVPTGTLRYRAVDDRKHNLFLTLIALGLGLKGLYLLQAALLDDMGGFATVGVLFLAIITLAVARGFMKRKGWAFLLVSVGLLAGWMATLILAIVEIDHGGWDAGSVYLYSFLLTNVLIGYLGRRSMEARFRPQAVPPQSVGGH